MTVKDAYAILKKECIKGKKLKIIECLEFDDFYGFFLPPFAPSRRMYIRLRVAKRRFSPKSDYPPKEAAPNLHLRQPPFSVFS